jgi:hypothetical protein
MTRRDFLGDEFFASLQQEYDFLRRVLKSHKGKPDAVTLELLRLDREWARILRKMMTGVDEPTGERA